ncbi:MAG: hypothetical protein B7Y56_11900 [Gallionellales bacterium 35-53-114]|jgi:hypothetical protein|nr:MAG: hypothetical protein B7Y56_11900 [Gallionellales bacterium 35-53-114]OYZ64698.1 MAG: hypothetical protein B7Y04_02700 [Gallionellales bacterium 24-53-125]OZB07763.1 MAG: hypothetical protein B7X61_14315 [Gallionellales bacterium 39-52-133]HQS58527.1 hypothetical protein [Gallionellaceae bacterium]HQS74868.1 hypothetical protein [Gallionellaceae bacterium]
MGNSSSIQAADASGFTQSRSLSRSFFGAAALALVIILPGCATYSSGFAKVEQAAAVRDLDGAVKTLDELKLTGADEALHHLNKGTLLRLQGNYAESNKHFDIAKELADKLNAISVSEQLASVSVNDTMKAYEGLPSEQLMLYSFKALNYLQMSDVDAAAVEARQFDIKQSQIAKQNADAKYLSGAFVRYLNAMVYEAAGERDSARIELQKALDGYKKQNSGFPVPASLTADLARIKAGKPAPSEVVFILQNGLGPSLHEATVRIANPNPQNGSSLLSLAVPKLAKRSVPVARIELSAGSAVASAEVVEDVNDIAEKSLNDRLPGITARAVARMVVKNAAVGETKKRSNELGAFGLLANIAMDVGSAVSERADTRTWSLLPGVINMARLPLPAGKHDITATYYSESGAVLATRVFKDIEIKPGRKAFVSDYYLNPPAQAKAPQ